jgi:signal transduction histidine kinase
MKALDGISKRSRIALSIAVIIMAAFFLVQTCVVFEICPNLYKLDVFGYLCVIAFIPPFSMVVYEFIKKKEDVAAELNKKNIYLEHAAKIIRHDMHSGINTYLPRGINSLKRRLSADDIQILKIESPLRLIEDGLAHARKVYSGVYEFTNLVKENAYMSTAECSIKNILSEYLRLTAYQNQVLLDESLPTIKVNEPLFCTAIDNLIRNGLKYNDSPTKWVKIYSEDDKYLCVEDNGRGLSQSDFIKLSEPYTRKKNQKESGTGLGLNICVQILKEHGFDITAEKSSTGTKLKIKYRIDD